MYCKNCGNCISDDAKFCSVCGTPTASFDPPQQPEGQVFTPPEEPISPTQETPPYQQQPESVIYEQPPTAPISPAYAQSSAYMPNPAPAPMPSPMPNGKQKKKGKAGKIAAIILAVIIFIGVVTGVALGLSWQKIARAAMGELDFYLWREASTISSVLASDKLDDLFVSQDFSAETDAKLVLNTEDLVIDFDVDMSHSSSDKQTVATLNPTVSEEGDSVNLGKFELNYSNGVFGLSAKEVTDKQFVINFAQQLGEDLISATNDGTIEELAQLVLSASEAISDAEEKAFSDGAITTGKQEFEGKSYNSVTFTINEKTAAEFLYVLANELNDDAKFRRELENYLDAVLKTAGTFDEGVSMNASQIIDQLLDTLDDAKEYSSDRELFTYTVFYNFKGDIVNRRIVIPGLEPIDVKTVVDKNNASVSFNIAEDEFKLNVVLEKTESGSEVSYNLDVQVTEDESTVGIILKADNLSVKDCNGVKALAGSINLEFTEGYENYKETILLKINSTADNDTYVIKATGNIDGESSYTGGYSNDIFSLEINSKLSDTPDVSSFERPDTANGVSFEEFFDDFFEHLYY